VLNDAHIKDVTVPGSLGAQESVHVGMSSGVSRRVMSFGSPPSGTPAVSSRSLDTAAVWDADAEAMAEWLQRHGNFSDTRVDGVMLDVWPYATAASTDVRDGVVAGDVGWLRRADVEFTPARGVARAQMSWVEAESHAVDYAAGTWQLQLGLSPFQTDYANVIGTALRFGDVIGSKVPGV
jgi:hypothetical protein